jgi:hypothetical protein
MDQKIFVISIQRTGTTSTGFFFKQHGFEVAGWFESDRNGWPELACRRAFDEIFQSEDFKTHAVFEDAPWFFPGLYRRLYERIPDSKFVHFTRNSDDWFKSMVSHSGGWTLGDVERHCMIWGRDDDYRWLREHGMLRKNPEGEEKMVLWDKPGHYIGLYEKYNREAHEFFGSVENAGQVYFHCDLEDPEKWLRLGEFVGVELLEGTNYYVNKSVKPNRFKSFRRNLRNKIRNALSDVF